MSCELYPLLEYLFHYAPLPKRLTLVFFVLHMLAYLRAGLVEVDVRVLRRAVEAG